MKRIITFISIIVFLLASSCSMGNTGDDYMTVRTELDNKSVCYKMSVPSKEVAQLKKLLLDDGWVFDYNEELRINSKYKVYSGDESFYVAPDTDYVFLRVAEGEIFEWRKADKESDIAKKAIELLEKIEKKYRPNEMPSDWTNYCLYDPDEEGQSKYYAAIEDADAKTLADALDNLEYANISENRELELAIQYSVVLDDKTYYVTNDTDEVIVEKADASGYSYTELANDSEWAKKINQILEKTVDIDPEFWYEYSY